MKTKKLIQTHSRGGTLPVFIKTQFRAAEDSNFKFSLYGKGMLEHEESKAASSEDLRRICYVWRLKFSPICERTMSVKMFLHYIYLSKLFLQFIP